MRRTHDRWLLCQIGWIAAAAGVLAASPDARGLLTMPSATSAPDAAGRAETVDELAQKLRTAANGPDRMRAASRLGGLGGDAVEALPALREAMGDEDARVRALAMTAISRIANLGPDTYDAVKRALADDDTQVQLSGLRAIEENRLTGPMIRDLLQTAAGDFSPSVRAEAMGCSARHPEIARQLLETGLNDPMWIVRSAAAECVWRIDDPTIAEALLPQVLRLAADAEPAPRARAIESLGRFAPRHPEVVPALIKAVDDPDHTVHSSAVEALGNRGIRSRQAVDVLASMIDEGAGSWNYGAAESLARLGVPGRKELIHRLANASVREAIRSEHVPVGLVDLPELQELLGSEDDKSRAFAAEAAGDSGRELAALVPWLVRNANDKSQKVRAASIWALGGMGAAGAKPLLNFLENRPDLRDAVLCALARLDGDAVESLDAAMRSDGAAADRTMLFMFGLMAQVAASKNATAWSTADGLAVRLTLDGLMYGLGDIIEARIELKNVSAYPLQVIEPKADCIRGWFESATGTPVAMWQWGTAQRAKAARPTTEVLGVGSTRVVRLLFRLDAPEPGPPPHHREWRNSLQITQGLWKFCFPTGEYRMHVDYVSSGMELPEGTADDPASPRRWQAQIWSPDRTFQVRAEPPKSAGNPKVSFRASYAGSTSTAVP